MAIYFKYFIFLFVFKPMTKINVEEFVDTPVIQKLKQKQDETKEEEDKVEKVETKSTRGRKRKYNTEEERIQARRAQQKAYRERKKKEFEELKAKATKEEVVEE